MNPVKVKIFTYLTTHLNPPNEQQLNDWLAENPNIEIVHILQSESMVAEGGDMERNLSITVFYREP